MLWNTKNEMPIGSGSRSRKSIGTTPVRWTAAASTNRNLYLKNASRPRLKTMPAGIQKVRLSNASTRQRWVPSTDEQQRQQLGLPEAIEEHACKDEQRDLEAAQ